MDFSIDSFGSDVSVAVIGGSGGIGQAFTRALAGSPNVRKIYTLGRRPHEAPLNTTFVPLDLEDEISIVRAAKTVRAEVEHLHIILLTTGILHDGAEMQPEKFRTAISSDAMARSFRINSIGPALVAKHFLSLLPRDRKSAFAALGARVGSIADNRLGGWYSYRASKAALHMLVRTFSIELSRTHKQALCVALHPGTVATTLSKPFLPRQPDSKVLSPDQSAVALLNTLDGLTPDDSGRVFAWDGLPVPY